MSANKSRPHVIVLPEDRKNLELANGFQLQIDWNRQRQMKVLPSAGGWMDVLAQFQSDQVSYMRRYPSRFMVLLIDFDDDPDRLQYVRAQIPDDLRERVFIVGVLTEPEDLRGDFGTPERAGAALAEDCRQDTDGNWMHRLLIHNSDEVAR
jgi:hypothetical protein